MTAMSTLLFKNTTPIHQPLWIKLSTKDLFHPVYSVLSAWGDAIFLLIQTAGIMALQLAYSTGTGAAVGFVTITSIVLYILMSGLVPLSVLWMMQAACIPLMLCGKVR